MEVVLCVKTSVFVSWQSMSVSAAMRPLDLCSLVYFVLHCSALRSQREDLSSLLSSQQRQLISAKDVMAGADKVGFSSGRITISPLVVLSCLNPSILTEMSLRLIRTCRHWYGLCKCLLSSPGFSPDMALCGGSYAPCRALARTS